MDRYLYLYVYVNIQIQKTLQGNLLGTWDRCVYTVQFSGGTELELCTDRLSLVQQVTFPRMVGNNMDGG